MEKYLEEYLTKIIRKYIDKIGEVDSESYNEILDNICSDLVYLRCKIQNIDCKIKNEFREGDK